MKSKMRLGSALILGASLVAGIGTSAFAQAPVASGSSDVTANGGTTPATAAKAAAKLSAPRRVGATSAKANAKIKKAMMKAHHGKMPMVKPHSAAARESGPVTSPTAVVSGVSGSGVASPPPSSATPGAPGTSPTNANQ